MSLQSRRNLLRWLFVICCLAPTAAVGGASAWRHSSWHREGQARLWEARLTRWLGVAASVGAWRESWSGEQQLLAVRLEDPESGEALAGADAIVISRRNGRSLVRLEGGELRTRSARALWNAAHERLLRGPDAPDWKGLVVAKEAVLWLDEEPMTVRDLRCSYVGGEASRSAIVEFGLAWYDTDQAVRWEVLRQRDGADPTTHWKIDCRDSPLPCRVLAAWGLDRWLGESAEFAGVAAGAHSRLAGDVFQVQGVLHRVDLAAVTRGPGERSGVQGTAQVQLDRAVWNQGVLVQVQGRCDALRGTADPVWLQAFARGIHARRLAVDEATGPLVWSDLHGVFRLDRGGLLIRGDCQRFGAAAEALLARGDQPLLTPEGSQAPLASLIHYLAPLTQSPQSFAAAAPAPAPLSAEPAVRVAAE